MEIIHLAQDELEALHLCDGEGMTQEEAGVNMSVSRGTAQRLLANARCKVAKALVGQKAPAISGNTSVAIVAEYIQSARKSSGELGSLL